MTGQTPTTTAPAKAPTTYASSAANSWSPNPAAPAATTSPAAARTIAAILNHVIAPLIAGIRTPRRGRPPKHSTNIDRDYETLRLRMQTLLGHLGIATAATP
jgi:hypothetical protein